MIRILVVDDSAFMRQFLSDMLNESDDLQVTATAKNGYEALDKVREYRPDVITLDVAMPGMDGLHTLKRIMNDFPTPVVMVSAYTQKGAEATIESLESGAVDFVAKPDGPVSLNIHKIKEELVSKIRIAVKIELEHLIKEKPKEIKKALLSKVKRGKIVAIGSSTGGPKALSTILPALPKNLPAGVVVVQHISADFTAPFASRLNSICGLEIKEASEDDTVNDGEVLIAPGGIHLKISPQRKVVLTEDPPRHGVRPSVDTMMESIAEVYGENSIGVILTGMGKDGSVGMKRIKEVGGKTIAEDRSTCVVFGMPNAAISTGCVDKVVKLTEIPKEVIKALK